MIEEDQIGQETERMPGAEAAGEFVVPAELEAYFDRVDAEKGERAAAEAVLAEAERRAAAQADRSMHLTDSAKETVNGALSRIGADLDAGKDAGDALDEVKEQIVRLQAEERASLAALRNELAPVAQQPDEPVAAEKPAAPDRPATPEPATEMPAANPADAWSADERGAISAYLDVLDDADRAHAELMKAKRELKKITNTETDEWKVAADKATSLEKAWRDKKADARARETAFGALDTTLVDLDVGRKAGRETLRRQLADAIPAPAVEPAPTVEPTPVTEAAPVAPAPVESPAPAEDVKPIRLPDYRAVAANWKSEENYVRDMTVAQLEERLARTEQNFRDSLLDASRRPDTVDQREKEELSYWRWKNEAWRELLDEKKSAEAAKADAEKRLAERSPEKAREDAAEDLRWSDAVVSELNYALQEREDNGFNALTPTSGEMISALPEGSPLTTPRGEEPEPTPERGVRAKIDAYRALIDVISQSNPYARPPDGTMREDPDSLARLVRIFQDAPRLRETIPEADLPKLAESLREVAATRGVPGAAEMPDRDVLSWAERTAEETTQTFSEKADRLYSY